MIKSTVKTITGIISELSENLYKLREIAPDLPKRIHSVHYVLSSPWILSESKSVGVTFDHPTAVTDQLIHNMINEEREKMSVEVKALGESFQIEEKIFDVKLNGYSVSNWIGKKVNALSVSFVTSISGTKMVERFIDMCMPIVKSRNVFFHSSLLLQYVSIGHIFPQKKSYTIVHVHGEITDIVVVKQHDCVFFGTYPIGTETILRSISREGNVGLDTASSMKTLSASGMLDDSLGNESQIVDVNHDIWLHQFQKVLEIGKQVFDDSIPVLLSVDEGSDDFSKALMRVFPNAKIESLTKGDLDSEVVYEPSCTRTSMNDFYVIALEKFRLRQ